MSASILSTWSLRRRLLAWLFLAMALVFTANLASSYYSTIEAADSAYDRLLLASASAIAERITVDGDRLVVDLPYAALDMLASTAQDRVFYAIMTPAGRLVTGYEGLPGGAVNSRNAAADPVFYNASYKNTAVRVVSLKSFVSGSALSGYATVRVAQTRGDRDALTFALLRQSSLWMLVIALAGAVAAWIGITNGLKPLNRLSEALGRRSPEDTRPVLHDVPEEFTSLVGAINSMLARLEDGFTVMGHFISNASHQLKTPLAGLRAQTEMALRETDTEQLRASLDKVNQSARRTSRLAHQLLSHARATETLTRLENMDLAELSRKTITGLLPGAIAGNMDFGYDGPDACAMTADVTLIGELIQNLAENAISYCPDGSIITIRVRKFPDKVVLSIEDNGPGIPQADREMVMDRFVRLPNSSGEGCGLGLAIAREIVTRHGGSIKLSDTRGGGLTVTAVFPDTDIKGISE